MTVTILSLVCIGLAALCLCLWVYAASAGQDAAEAMWEASYYEELLQRASPVLRQAVPETKRGRTP